mmetsp:Transcript_47544/g.152764  ORF Transcript_47544/g.152764 Transcript_47544/m.152764 type:complete len:216 (-) Transcript_47544:1456-2103(-)
MAIGRAALAENTGRVLCRPRGACRRLPAVRLLGRRNCGSGLVWPGPKGCAPQNRRRLRDEGHPEDLAAPAQHGRVPRARGDHAGPTAPPAHLEVVRAPGGLGEHPAAPRIRLGRLAVLVAAQQREEVLLRGRGGARLRTDLKRAGLLAPEQCRAPRHQAGEHPRVRRQCGEARGLRLVRRDYTELHGPGLAADLLRDLRLPLAGDDPRRAARLRR